MEAAAQPATQEAPAPDQEASVVASDIGTVAKVALKETLAELGSSAWKTSSASSQALRKLRAEAGRHLGFEIKIEDPAFRELFSHMLQTERLLCQVREHALALSNGAKALASCGGAAGFEAPGLLMESLLMLEQTTTTDPLRARDKENTTSGGETCNKGKHMTKDIVDATRASIRETMSLSPNPGSARYWMERRLQEEVLAVIDEQLLRHEHVRKQFRKRQHLRESLGRHHWEVAAFLKSHKEQVKNSGSGLRPLGSASGPLSDAEQQMQAAQAAIANLDSDILSQLLDLQRDAHVIVSRPWVALSQIRTQFFALFARHWAPVATSLGAGLEVFSNLERAPGRKDEDGKIVDTTTSPSDGAVVTDDKSNTHSQHSHAASGCPAEADPPAGAETAGEAVAN
mmetsp:Transcript_126086/g.251764  ORF Transcript_126086/g.251764 Transcript_126086/m.251764 type:complete len:400 (+) Transcript_126086:78-1277(+)|eukprot:CAMPEP_0172871442 /NCGR_PEP_ID=MMETSP1075-20121228/92083_1 /TAXON_ID=2916 /ORGANISM="Ceratium fusus, Strain PA161109" /LENGTH=399 /DNA_ID=CAMNT_0013721679 /DNA_START=77 /DNA_END=1276 /DNA_ORIENTATION=+